MFRRKAASVHQCAAPAPIPATPDSASSKGTPMKKIIIPAAAAMSLLLTAAFAPTVVAAKHRCDNPSGIADTRACAKAAEGRDALRNFVVRTRMIYSLYYWDYAPRDDQRAAASASVQPSEPTATDSDAVAIATNPG